MKKTGRALPLILVALVAVSAVAVGVLGWRSFGDARIRGAQDAALAAARTGVAQVLSYDAKNVQAEVDASRKLVSGDFAAKYEKLVTQVIAPAAQQGLSTKATVSRAGLIDADLQQAHVLVQVSQASTVGGAPQSQQSQNQVGVTMTRVGGQWLISDLKPL